MTDFILVKGTQSERPAELDTESSVDTVYEREDIKWVTANDETPFDHWEYMERTYNKDEWAARQLIKLNGIEEDLQALLLGMSDLYELQLGGV